MIRLIKNFLNPVTVKIEKDSDYNKFSFNLKTRQILEYDITKCVGCFNCAKSCPVSAIKCCPSVKKVSIDLGICVGCARCRDVCPMNCFSFKNKKSVAVSNKNDLIIGYREDKK